jgi:tetratricopeptide (TPR) repeat protein
MGSDAGGRPDVAERILAEARRTNPRDYQVYLESGRLAIKINDLPRAGVYFATALRLWPGALDREDPRVLEDLATIQVCRGLLFEEAGDLARAQELYRQVLRDFPDRTPLRKRLEFIEAQGHSPSPPFEFWRPLLFRHAHVCAQEPEEHEKK